MRDVVVTLGNGIPTSLAEWLNNFQKMAYDTGFLWMAHDAKKFADALKSAECEPDQPPPSAERSLPSK